MECKRPRRLQSRGRLRILVQEQEQEQGRGQGLLLGGRCFQLLALVDTVHPFIAPN